MAERVKRRSSSVWVAGASISMAVLAAIALGVTVFVAQRALADASDVVVRGEGDVLVGTVIGDLLEDDGAPTAASLAREVEKNEAAGLRYVAVVSSHNGVMTTMAESGVAKIPDAASRPGALTVVGSRARVVAGFPRRPPRAGWGPRPTSSADPDPTSGGPRPPPFGPLLLVVELEPPVIATLQSDLRRISIVAAVAVAVLLAFAFALARTARRLAAIEAQAAREQRLVALGGMSSVMAHELRNPLASLKGHAQLLVEDLDDEKKRAKAERVVAEAERLEELTTSLLDFVRDGPIDVGAVGTDELIARSLDDLPRARIDVDRSRVPSEIFVDASRVVRALHNVVHNALQTTSGDERVDVRVEAVGRDVVIEVRDRGPGIPAGSESEIFEPFVTTRVRGTGLGLPVARRIAEQHGGTLTGENHPDGGALFRLRLADAIRKR